MTIKPLLAAVGLFAGCGQLPSTTIPDSPQPEAPAVVFDIDGTLTPDVASITQVRPDAAKAALTYAERGYKVIYLSARVSLLQAGIPQWLKDNGFPAGTLHVAQTDREREQVAAFKTDIMKAYTLRGWRLVGGYGDSSTDFEAYANAGIPKDQVFALRRRGDATCQPGTWQTCLQGWGEHLDYIERRRD